MPARATAPLGAPCWIELLTSDTAASRRFYAELFGWTAEEPSPEFGGYFMFTRQGVPVAGGMPSQPDMGPDRWAVYLATDDARKAVEATLANGGEVIVPATEVADLGTMAVIADPGGAAIGMWQAGAFGGFSVLAEPGAPSWFELQTRDYQGVLSFYRTVFGWDTQVLGESPEMAYTVLRHGDEFLAGVMDASGVLPGDRPAHWSVYFGVADTDAALARTVELGGSVLQAAEDTPYGRLAGAADPTGAPFKLVAPNEAMPARDASA